MARKTFNEKLNFNGDLPKLETLTDPDAVARNGGPTLLIAPPLAYDALMKRIPAGRLTTVDQLRAHLTQDYGADNTCQLTAGIFVRIAVEASEERAGVDPTPWQRTLKKGGELNEKYPGGIEAQRLLLEAEGHEVTRRGKRWFVTDFEAKLAEL